MFVGSSASAVALWMEARVHSWSHWSALSACWRCREKGQASGQISEDSNAWRSPYRVRAPSVRAFGRLREDPLDTTKPVLKAVKNGAPRPRRAAAMAARRALALMLLIASGSLTLGAQDDGSELQPPCASLPALRADDASRLPVHSIAAAVAAAAGGRTSW